MTYQQIVVVWVRGVLLGGVADTQAQSHEHQIEQHVDFRLEQWKHLVIGADDVARDLHRVVAVEHRVRQPDRQLSNRRTLQRVAHIDEADNASLRPCGLPLKRADDDVTIVTVVVDHARAQLRKQRIDMFLEARAEPVNALAGVVVAQQRQPGLEGVPGVQQVPLQAAVGGFVLEPVERRADVS